MWRTWFEMRQKNNWNILSASVLSLKLKCFISHWQILLCCQQTLKYLWNLFKSLPLHSWSSLQRTLISNSRNTADSWEQMLERAGRNKKGKWVHRKKGLDTLWFQILTLTIIGSDLEVCLCGAEKVCVRVCVRVREISWREPGMKPATTWVPWVIQNR